MHAGRHPPGSDPELFRPGFAYRASVRIGSTRAEAVVA
jgi:hypothetical protein